MGMRLIGRRIVRYGCTLAITLSIWKSAAAASDTPISDGLFAGWTPIADVRIRYEDVGQVPIAEDAEALTVRARLGFQSVSLWDTALLAEGNFLIPIDDRYRPDNAVASYTRFPVVADARDHELNRLALINKSLPHTTVTVGRQRILLDDQRFVGNVGWRQDEQTFDALRVVNTSVSNLTVDATFMNRVHRVYTDDSPQGTYDGSIFLGNIGYRTPIGKLTAFAYLLSFDPLVNFPGLTKAAATALNPILVSTSTYGGRFSGDRKVNFVKLSYVLSYARQQQRGDNPNHFSNDYFLGELGGTIGPVTLTAGDEVMRGNGIIGFATPLATTHAFDGWADKFLNTPANGLENGYGSLAYVWPRSGPLRNLTAKAIYRSFAPQHVEGSYGSEWDFLVSAKWGRFTPALIMADYRAAASTPITIARDTKKLFIQLEFSL